MQDRTLQERQQLPRFKTPWSYYLYITPKQHFWQKQTFAKFYAAARFLFHIIVNFQFYASSPHNPVI